MIHSLQTGIGPLIPQPFAFTPALQAGELRIGTTYAASNGGLLPHDAFWEYLIYRHDINPVTFDRTHPQFATLLNTNETVTNQDNILNPLPAGLVVPNTPYWNYLRYRHDSSPVNFDHYHPQFAALLDQDEQLRQTPTPTPTPAPQQIIPPTVFPPPSGDTTPPITVAGGTFTPGTPLQVPGGQTTPPQIAATPEPSSAIVLGSGLLIIFVAARLTKGWIRPAAQKLGPAKT